MFSSMYLLCFYFVITKKGCTFMTVTEERSSQSSHLAQLWEINVSRIVYAALGAALYGGLSYVTNVLQLPGAGNVSLRPAIVIPLLFAVLFGPLVGLFAGGVGNILGDAISGYGIFWNWDLGNALIGFIAGLAILYTFSRYTRRRNIIIAEIFSAIAIIIGIGFASYTDIWVSKYSFQTATLGELVPAALSDLVNGLILLPILLVAYAAAVRRSGRS
jgi:energy-coupling factor transport system substrate-specific component